MWVLHPGGEVREETTVVVPFTTYSREGEKLREFRSPELNHLDAAQVVYAGVERDSAPSDEHGGNSRVLAIAGWVLIGGAAVGATAVLLRRRTQQ